MSPQTIRTIYDVASATSVLVFLVLGMAVIVGMMRVFNLCQGELVLLGAISAYLGYRFLGSVAVGIVAAPVVGLFGAALERRKMVGLARVLLGRPRLLVLDEPTEGVWYGVVAEILDALRVDAATSAILLVEQHLDLALELADHAVVLQRGEIVPGAARNCVPTTSKLPTWRREPTRRQSMNDSEFGILECDRLARPIAPDSRWTTAASAAQVHVR